VKNAVATAESRNAFQDFWLWNDKAITPFMLPCNIWKGDKGEGILAYESASGRSQHENAGFGGA
jgi:hypothetical protein